MKGMTLKQAARASFFDALEKYDKAVNSKDKNGIVVYAIKLHVLKSSVPKSLWPLVNKIFKKKRD